MRTLLTIILLLFSVVAVGATETVVSTMSTNLCNPRDAICLYMNLTVTPSGATVTYVIRTSGGSPNVIASGDNEPLDSSSYTVSAVDGVVIHPKFMVFFDARTPRYRSTMEQHLTVEEYVPDSQTTVTTETFTTATKAAADVGARVNGKSLSPCWGCGQIAITRTLQQ